MKRAEKILEQFASPNLIIRRDFVFGEQSGCLLFAAELCDKKTIGEILFALGQRRNEIEDAAAVIRSVIYTAEAVTELDSDTAAARLMDGDCVVVIDGSDEVILANTRAWEKRGVSEPASEAVTRGPREGFTEDLTTNLSLLARRLRSSQLAVERLKIGRRGNTAVALVYLSGICASETVEEIKKRLKKIDIDTILDSSGLEPYLEERPYSIFKQTGGTERPDIAASKISEGRVAIIVDGSPVVLTLPFLLIEDFHSAEDHYQRFSITTFLRFLRIFSFIAALILPGFYVSLLQFHFDLAPLPLLSRLMNAAAATPFSPLLEMLLVVGLFEVIREAAVRMPRIVSMAMSIVGAIVLSEAIVKAGIIGSPSILIVAISSIALFTAPLSIGSATLLRILFTVLGGLLGFYGIILGLVFLVHYLSTIDSYGSPYLAPLAPFIGADQGDAVIKRPLFELKKRPKSVRNQNATRQS